MVGIMCIMCALATLLIMIPAILYMSATKFYQHYAYGDQAVWTVGDYTHVVARSWVYILVTIMVFGQTMTVHPAVTALVVSTSPNHNDWTDKFFLPVTCFLVQAVFDWIGRSIATYSQWPSSGRFAEWFLALLVIARTGFLPLIMGCNLLPGIGSIRHLHSSFYSVTGDRTTEVMFPNDWEFVLIFAVFNIVGGYISNAALMLGPKMVGVSLNNNRILRNNLQVIMKYQELAGTLLLFGLVAGLGLGSLFGPLLVALL